MRREDFNDKCKRGFRVLVSHFNPYLHNTLIFALKFQQKITLSVIEIRFIRLEIATETKGDLQTYVKQTSSCNAYAICHLWKFSVF